MRQLTPPYEYMTMSTPGNTVKLGTVGTQQQTDSTKLSVTGWDRTYIPTTKYVGYIQHITESAH